MQRLPPLPQETATTSQRHMGQQQPLRRKERVSTGGRIQGVRRRGEEQQQGHMRLEMEGKDVFSHETKSRFQPPESTRKVLEALQRRVEDREKGWENEEEFHGVEGQQSSSAFVSLDGAGSGPAAQEYHHQQPTTVSTPPSAASSSHPKRMQEQPLEEELRSRYSAVSFLLCDFFSLEGHVCGVPCCCLYQGGVTFPGHQPPMENR